MRQRTNGCSGRNATVKLIWSFGAGSQTRQVHTKLDPYSVCKYKQGECFAVDGPLWHLIEAEIKSTSRYQSSSWREDAELWRRTKANWPILWSFFFFLRTVFSPHCLPIFPVWCIMGSVKHHISDGGDAVYIESASGTAIIILCLREWTLPFSF